MKKIMFFAFLICFLASNTSGVSVSLIQNPILSPGGEGVVSLEVENTLSRRIELVSVELKFEDLPFIPIGSSEGFVDEIDEDEEENFLFKIKASNNIIPGDYTIPYALSYEIGGDQKTKSGSIGLKVKANPDLSFSLNSENPVLNQKSDISLKIVNKGFFDARFVSIKIIPSGMVLLSEKDIYIGTIDSDDFETASFEVLFTNQFPVFNAIIEYKDFENQIKKENISIPLQIYTEEKAIELGIIQENKTSKYVLSFIILIIFVFVFRFFRKKSRMRKSVNRV